MRDKVWACRLRYRPYVSVCEGYGQGVSPCCIISFWIAICFLDGNDREMASPTPIRYEIDT